MPEMFCCTSRMRIERNGVALVFYEHIEQGGDVRWQACQIYESDRWICPECKRYVIAGLGARPIIERWQGAETFDNYLADLLEGRLTDIIGRTQPWVDVYE